MVASVLRIMELRRRSDLGTRCGAGGVVDVKFQSVALCLQMKSSINIPYGQSSAKLPVTLSLGHLVIMSFCFNNASQLTN